MFTSHIMSSSSWGCELKCYFIKQRIVASCHPPREDVSWNTKTAVTGGYECCHPPREDVSWNKRHIIEEWKEQQSSSSWGCELKCHNHLANTIFTWSSSSWGCELKCLYIRKRTQSICHPPREDVSRNYEINTTRTRICVILLVRMWVEIKNIVL